jgi:tetratricopeptide (TPR) repeat protein
MEIVPLFNVMKSIFFVFMVFCILLSTTFGQEDIEIKNLMQQGRNAFNQSLYDKALNYFDQIIEKDPSNAEAWYRKGLATADPREFDWRNQDNEGALKCYQKATELNPLYEEALVLEGWTLAVLGNPEEGLKKVNKAIEINATSDLAWNYKGGVLFFMGDLEGTLPCIDMAMKYNPNWGDPPANKGYLLEELGRSAEADEYTRKAESLSVRAY